MTPWQEPGKYACSEGGATAPWETPTERLKFELYHLITGLQDWYRYGRKKIGKMSVTITLVTLLVLE